MDWRAGASIACSTTSSRCKRSCSVRRPRTAGITTETRYEAKPGWFCLIARAAAPQALLPFRYMDGTCPKSYSSPRVASLKRDRDGRIKSGLQAPSAVGTAAPLDVTPLGDVLAA